MPTIFRVTLYFMAFFIYATVALTSYGYDDEFFNINLVERYGLNAYLVTQEGDVHPPLSYLLNAIQYELFGNWRYVRLMSALLNLCAFIYAAEYIYKSNGLASAVIGFLLIAFNPAMLMWCVSVRWYAYFVPVLVWLMCVPRKDGWGIWAKLFSGFLILGYIGYASFIVGPPLFLLYWMNSRSSMKDKLIQSGSIFTIMFTFYLPQLLVFLNVHIQGKESQVSSIFRGISGFLISQLSNQGVFPLSVAGLISVTGSACVFFSILDGKKHYSFLKDSRLLSFALFSVLLVASGLAGKFRNLLLLGPFQSWWISSAYVRYDRLSLYYTGISFILIANAFGLCNIVNHRDTTKNSLNIPVSSVIEFSVQERERCNGDMVIFLHDPTLQWWLNREGFDVYGPYADSNLSALNDMYSCALIIITYKGSLSDEKYSLMAGEIDRLSYEERREFSFGTDDYYMIKRWYDHSYPKIIVQIIEITNGRGFRDMKNWTNMPW